MPEILSPTLHTMGNIDLIALHKVAFLCSRSCPETASRSSLAWADLCRREGTCVVSGCHSSVEKAVYRTLANRGQPMIVVLAQGLRVPPEPEFADPLAEGKLLMVSRYAATVTHPCEEKCLQRNRMMMEMAEEIVVGFAVPGGNLERLCREFQARKQVTFLAVMKEEK